MSKVYRDLGELLKARLDAGLPVEVVTVTGERVCLACEASGWAPCDAHAERTSGAYGVGPQPLPPISYSDAELFADAQEELKRQMAGAVAYIRKHYMQPIDRTWEPPRGWYRFASIPQEETSHMTMSNTGRHTALAVLHHALLDETRRVNECDAHRSKATELLAKAREGYDANSDGPGREGEVVQAGQDLDHAEMMLAVAEARHELARQLYNEVEAALGLPVEAVDTSANAKAPMRSARIGKGSPY